MLSETLTKDEVYLFGNRYTYNRPAYTCVVCISFYLFIYL